jgi:hypothetical protein
MAKTFKGLSDAANAVLTEGSKETFDANIASKRGMRGQMGTKPEVGIDAVKPSVAYGSKSAGMVGQSPEEKDDSLPDYLSGTPQATPPGATPPVGSQPDGVGAARPKGQPQETMGRKDLHQTMQTAATEYEALRDRKAATLPKNTFGTNAGATFQHYDGSHTAGAQAVRAMPGGVSMESVDYDDEEVIYEEDEAKMAKKGKMHAMMKEKMKEDIDALLSGENLSEEFVAKATTIFEAAVIARAEEVIAEAEAELVEQFESTVEQIKEDLASKVDDYLNYMVEEWMKDNELAIEKGLRTEITEEFITGLKSLFEEHYIDIPSEKVDVVEELTAKVDELQSEINEQIKQNIDLKKNLNEQKKNEAIYTACEGLTQTQVEKLKTLAEGVQFNNDEEFAQKLSTLKESYFKVDVKVADNSALDDEVEILEEGKTVRTSSEMDIYAKAISQTLAK